MPNQYVVHGLTDNSEATVAEYLEQQSRHGLELVAVGFGPRYFFKKEIPPPPAPKTIVVRGWVDTESTGLQTIDLHVVTSDHPRFIPGRRWDSGFADQALREGYTVTVIPDEPPF